MRTEPRVLFIVHGLYPIPGHTVTGNGIRAWGLAQGLKTHGCRISYATPAETAWPGWDKSWEKGREKGEHPGVPVRFFEGPPDLNRLIRTVQPDVLVVINWEFIEWLEQDHDLPVVVDLAAPRLLEMQFQPELQGAVDTEIFRYLRMLSRGSRFLCSTEKQKAFYRSWLMLSGIDSQEESIDVVPISAGPTISRKPRRLENELTFVHGGVFWPWQRPTQHLTRLLSVLDRRHQGTLVVIGGAYPLAQDRSHWKCFPEDLGSSERLMLQPLLPYDEMEAAFLNADVAVDLAERNPERELSFSYRILEYLRCGLPVICNHYLAIAPDIEAYEAGWVVNTEDDATAFEDLIEQLLSEPSVVARRSQNAQRLARERYNWERTTQPLYRYCLDPKKPQRRTPMLQALLSRQHALEGQLERQTSELSRQEAQLSGQQGRLAQLHESAISLRGDIHGIEETIRDSERRLIEQLERLVSMQHALERQVTVLSRRGLLRWFGRIPERVYRVLIKPLLTRRHSKNIAVITRGDLFPPHHGAAVRILESARALSRHCDKVLLITADRSRYFVFVRGDMYEGYYPRFLQYFPFSATPILQHLLERKGIPSHECYLFYALYDLNFLARTLFLAYQYGIALYQAEFPAFLRPALLARRCFGGKAALVEHNVEFMRIVETAAMSGKGQQFVKQVETRLCNQADFVIAASRDDQEALRHAGVPGEKITVVPHGVNLESFTNADPEPIRRSYAIPSDVPVLVYHGPYSYAPNYEAALAIGTEILPALEKRGQKAICFAIGTDQPERSPHPWLKFTGGVDNIAAYLKCSDLAIIPLRAGGGTRMKILDYFAAKIPVVATKKAIEGLPVEHGKHLMIVESVDEMIEPILELLRDPDRRRDLAANAYAVVENLDWRVIATTYMDLYQLPWWKGEVGP